MEGQSRNLKRLAAYLYGLHVPCLKQDILRHAEAVGAAQDDLEVFRAIADTTVYHSKEQVIRALAEVISTYAPRT